MVVRIREGHVEPKRCPDPDKHEGLRTSLAAMKQHMIEVHGFVYEDDPPQRKAMRKTCPTCCGEGWIEA